MKLATPMTIDELLDQVLSDDPIMPPLANSAYLVSKNSWQGEPDDSSEVLYVGGNTKNKERFRVRIGELIAVLFGFFNDDLAGGHAGAKSLRTYCPEHKINPKRLYISWVVDGECFRCLENDLYDRYRPKLNKGRPNACPWH